MSQLTLFENTKLILSLYDYTEAWPSEYIKAGYPVICWDKKIEGDILEEFGWLQQQIEDSGMEVYGILAGPPCTDFASSGARWMKEKDKHTPGFEPFTCTTELSVALVLIVLHLVDLYKPKFWVIENPKGRIETLIPEIKPYRAMSFNPFDYGDPYAKHTILWGEFCTDLLKKPIVPVSYEYGGRKGSYMWAKLGGKSERTKALRSATPPGFAKAFFEANN